MSASCLINYLSIYNMEEYSIIIFGFLSYAVLYQILLRIILLATRITSEYVLTSALHIFY